MSSTPELLIRADASATMGTGHVMRCLALAQAWQDFGGTARYVTHHLPQPLVERLKLENVAVESIESAPGSKRDLNELASITERLQPAAVVLDGYQFDQSYCDATAQLPPTTLLIDDYGQLDHYNVEFVLNQNLGTDAELYQSRSPNTTVLLGPKYSLIRRELRVCEGRDRNRDGSVNKILVTLGGSDPNNVNATVCRGLMQLEDPDLKFRVLAGGLNSNLQRLVETVEGDPRFELFPYAENMAEQYVWADLAIAAGGSSNWEMCCYGLPRAIIVIAENQVCVARTLTELGVVLHLGRADVLVANELNAKINQLIGCPENILQLGNACEALCDGRGAVRIAEVLLQANKSESGRLKTKHCCERSKTLSLRTATMDDCELLLQWRNDPSARSASKQTQLITHQEHTEWLRKCLADQNRKLLIAECAKDPVGTVRFELDDEADHLEVSWSVAPQFRGRGIGRQMIEHAVAESHLPVRAVIRFDNVASQKIAEKTGFFLQHREGDWLTYLRISNREHQPS